MICAWIDTSSADTGSSQIDQLRSQRQRPGDADPLPLAAGELGREPVVVLRVEPDQLHQLLHAALALVGRRRCRGSTNGSPMIEPDPAPRVQRAVRVLEDHLDVPAQRAHLPAGQRGDVVAVEHHRPRRQVVEPGEAAGQRRLAAAGLADQSQRLARDATSRVTPSTACTTSCCRRSRRTADRERLASRPRARSSTSDLMAGASRQRARARALDRPGADWRRAGGASSGSQQADWCWRVAVDGVERGLALRAALERVGAARARTGSPAAARSGSAARRDRA